MTQETYLTGITTTGTPHIGNYVGAIRPSVASSKDKSRNNFYFLADYHSLAKTEAPDRIQVAAAPVQRSFPVAKPRIALDGSSGRLVVQGQQDLEQNGLAGPQSLAVVLQVGGGDLHLEIRDRRVEKLPQQRHFLRVQVESNHATPKKDGASERVNDLVRYEAADAGSTTGRGALAIFPFRRGVETRSSRLVPARMPAAPNGSAIIQESVNPIHSGARSKRKSATPRSLRRSQTSVAQAKPTRMALNIAAASAFTPKTG